MFLLKHWICTYMWCMCLWDTSFSMLTLFDFPSLVGLQSSIDVRSDCVSMFGTFPPTRTCMLLFTIVSQPFWFSGNRSLVVRHSPWSHLALQNKCAFHSGTCFVLFFWFFCWGGAGGYDCAPTSLNSPGKNRSRSFDLKTKNLSECDLLLGFFFIFPKSSHMILRGANQKRVQKWSSEIKNGTYDFGLVVLLYRNVILHYLITAPGHH